MSFRLKIGLSFCCILFLTIVVAVTSWWGMDTALKRQNSIFSFNLEVDRLFNAMATREHSFNATQKASDAREVDKTIDELYLTISNVKKGTNGSQQQQVEKVLAGLKRYQNDFARYSSQVGAIASLQSRMIQISERLLSGTSTLAGQGGDLFTDLLLQTSSMLQAEKTFMFSKSPASAQVVMKIITDTKTMARQVQDQTADLERQLQARDIVNAAAVYSDIFRSYLSEQKNLQKMIPQMHQSQKNLAAELRNLVDQQLVMSQMQVNRLQLLTIAVSLSTVFLSVVITLFLSDLITRPLEQLKNSAQDILAGKLDTTVSLHTGDEIGQLGQIFNQMTQKLRRNFEDIRSYRNHLEELVEERTLDLKKEMSERGSAEQALRSSEERLRTIVDQSPMGIILWNTKFQVTQWNQAAQRIFGYSVAEAIGLPAKQFLPNSMHPHIDKIWQKLITTESGIRSHNENITKEGKIIQCDWFNTPIFDSSETLLGALSLVENVTERMRTEKELLKLEKLESTGILAGGIAHDFNNILTAVLGNINLALFDDNLSAGTRSLLTSAEKASVRAKDLTQQLLTFAKGGEPIRESTSLAEIIKDSATFVLHGSNVSCTYRLPDDLWYAVVDRGQISQVIQNIVLNARHSMPQGGNVAITGQNVLPAEDPFSLLDPGSRYVKISIADNGVGIDAALIDKIFDPYFSTKQEGSGLGLAITHSIINKHRGHILVNSELAKGTEFILYLPATSRPATKEDGRQEPRAVTQPIRVLVMDDDKAVQMVLEAMLNKLGHSVVLASEGREAIGVYRSRLQSAEPIELVIVDLTIPGGLGGRETMVELLKVDPDVRAIVSSGYSTDPVMASFKEHGFRAAVTKPYTLKGLAEAIEVACG